MTETLKETPNALPPTASKKKRNHTLLWFTFGLVLLGILWYCLWFFYLRYHETTDDAYANGNMVNINAAVPGSVIAYFADDTDYVVEGQLIIQLDRTDYQIRYEKALASLAATVLQVKQVYSNVPVAQANMENLKAQLSKAQYDYNNRLQLVDFKAIAKEDFIHAKDSLMAAKAAFEQAQGELQVALDAAGNTPVELHPLILEKKASIREAFYDLQHCNIYAPSTGYVAQRTVEVGQWAAPTTNLMAIIPMDYLWVDANYKETQLEKMRIGQPATVWFDLYGSRHLFHGKVLGIASGTGSVFSIIPPQNATGNWIKIVQRLPVRISLDEEMIKKFPPRLGLSANVSVDLTDQSLPRLATTPSHLPVSTTKVFDISLENVDLVIDKIIYENLQNGSCHDHGI
ncbi:MAG: efflux RND transporter periplasmic adaptor subunit [Chlamydiales bacterium]|nr:efflux RND transporter periplasmic adaptor subunit [Chlamydiales bacterium]